MDCRLLFIQQTGPTHHHGTLLQIFNSLHNFTFGVRFTLFFPFKILSGRSAGESYFSTNVGVQTSDTKGGLGLNIPHVGAAGDR